MVVQSFSGKESAAIIGVHPAKSSQAMAPAWEKIARHWRVDPIRTIQTLNQWAVNRLDEMSDREIEMRELMLRGQIATRSVHPNGAPSPSPTTSA